MPTLTYRLEVNQCISCGGDSSLGDLPLNNLINEIFGQSFLRLIMRRHLLQDLRLPAPILKHLRRRFHEIARDTSSVESCIFGLAEEAMEDVAHFMEECNDIIVGHKSWSLGSRLGEVSDHRCDGIITLSRGKIVARNERPDSGMGVLGLCSIVRRSGADRSALYRPRG